MQVSGNGSYWDKLTEEFSYFWSFKNYFSILWEAFDEKFIKKITSLLGILAAIIFATRACRTVDFILSFLEFSLSLMEYLLSIIKKLLKLSEFIFVNFVKSFRNLFRKISYCFCIFYNSMAEIKKIKSNIKIYEPVLSSEKSLILQKLKMKDKKTDIKCESSSTWKINQLILKKWLNENICNPYASKETKKYLSDKTSLTEQQITAWLIYERQKLKKKSLIKINNNL